MLGLEPEPGCKLERINDVIQFWKEYLIPACTKNSISDETRNMHLGICYDTCHQAVQFEDAVETLETLKENQIPLAKMQLSAAIEFKPDFEKVSSELRESYVEGRFLHQTRIKNGKNGKVVDLDDLPQAIAQGDWSSPWRVHYHLPLFIDEVNENEFLTSTVSEMVRAYKWGIENRYCEHFEIETYTWNVLPENIRPRTSENLATGISREFNYVKNCLNHGAEIG